MSGDGKNSEDDFSFDDLDEDIWEEDPVISESLEDDFLDEDQNLEKVEKSRKKNFSFLVIAGTGIIILAGGFLYISSTGIKSKKTTSSMSLVSDNNISDEAVILSDEENANINQKNQEFETLDFSEDDSKIAEPLSSAPDLTIENSGVEEVLTPLPDLDQLENLDLSSLGQDLSMPSESDGNSDVSVESSKNENPVDVEDDFSTGMTEKKDLEESFEDMPLIEGELLEETEKSPQAYYTNSQDIMSLDPSEKEALDDVPSPSNSEEDEKNIVVVNQQEEQMVNEDEAQAQEPSQKEENSTEDISANELENEEKPVAVESKAEPKSVSWILKSAQPGQAVVYEKYSQETLAVEIGDNVRGLGKVKSIDKINGKWIVSGTQGTVFQ